MRTRLLALSAVLIGAALGAAGCSSSGASAQGGSAGTSAPGSSTGAPASGSAGSSSGRKAAVGKPGGTVTVKSGNKVVCVIKLDNNGTGTCKVNTKDYTPGKVTFTGTYNGTGGFKSGTGSTTLTVRPAKATS